MPLLDPEIRTVGQAASEVTRQFRDAGLPEARREAEILTREAAGLTREQFLAHPETALSGAARQALESFLVRRLAREPLPYLLGRAEFYGLTFRVTPAVLIPRPETELLVEETVARARAIRARTLVDVGAGSGAIAIVLARELPQTRVLAIDISAAALRITRENASRHSVTRRVWPVQADLLSAARGPVDAVVANLPYIGAAEMEALQPEVQHFEPRAALVGGYDGLAAIRRLSKQVAPVLSPGGFGALEVGAGQAEQVAALLEAGGLHDVVRLRDYAGHERIVLGWK